MNANLFNVITEWQDRTFPNSNVSSKLSHLKDEIEEVLAATCDTDIKEEFADCFILLMGAAHSYGMTYDDITTAVINKTHKNVNRKWGTPDERGVVKHVD